MKQLLLISVMLVLSGCAGKIIESPIDQYIRKYDSEPVYSVILWDMDVKGVAVKKYFHQYKVITEKDGEPREELQDWQPVSEPFFKANMDNVGMELVAKTEDGKIVKTPSPPGYSNYVGNEKYGRWTQRNDGTSFWEFYGQFMFMNAMFNLVGGSIFQNDYNDYRRNYYGRRSYYGPATSGGKKLYGTSGYSNSTKRTSAFQRKVSTVKSKTSTFKSKVNNRVSRSTGRSSSSSLRSRSGGFGK